MKNIFKYIYKLLFDKNKLVVDRKYEQEESGRENPIFPNKPVNIIKNGVEDESLYEKIKMQWQFGDWEALLSMELDRIESHPKRDKIALMLASAYLQYADKVSARKYINKAKEWGCGKKLLSQVLIAGVHNTLGKVALIEQKYEKSKYHFESSIAIASPGADQKLLTQARINEQKSQLQKNMIKKKIKLIKFNHERG
jgi:hypothetical protein